MPKKQEPIVFVDWGNAPEEERTKCKHDAGYGCEKCGTSNRRDAKHTTSNGTGVVGKLRKKKR